MSDFLGRLVQRNLGTAAPVQPQFRSLFAPGSELAGEASSTPFAESSEGSTAAHSGESNAHLTRVDKIESGTDRPPDPGDAGVVEWHGDDELPGLLHTELGSEVTGKSRMAALGSHPYRSHEPFVTAGDDSHRNSMAGIPSTTERSIGDPEKGLHQVSAGRTAGTMIGEQDDRTHEEPPPEVKTVEGNAQASIEYRAIGGDVDREERPPPRASAGGVHAEEPASPGAVGSDIFAEEPALLREPTSSDMRRSNISSVKVESLMSGSARAPVAEEGPSDSGPSPRVVRSREERDVSGQTGTDAQSNGDTRATVREAAWKALLRRFYHRTSRRITGRRGLLEHPVDMKGTAEDSREGAPRFRGGQPSRGLSDREALKRRSGGSSGNDHAKHSTEAVASGSGYRRMAPSKGLMAVQPEGTQSDRKAAGDVSQGVTEPEAASLTGPHPSVEKITSVARAGSYTASAEVADQRGVPAELTAEAMETLDGSIEPEAHQDPTDERSTNSQHKSSALQDRVPVRSAAAAIGVASMPAAMPGRPATTSVEQKLSNIKVTIGRIEVRGETPAPPAPLQAQPERRGPSVSLDEYLKRRNGGR